MLFNNNHLIKVGNEFDRNSDVFLHIGDTLKFCKSLPSGISTLIITSPPYNIGKEYEKRIDIHNYLSEQEEVIKELVRILSANGSLCWEVGNYVCDSEVFPLDIFYYQIFKRCGLKLRNRIIWRFGHGLHASKRFSGRYETILWFTKSDNYIFNLDSVRVPSKYPGKKHFKGPRKGMLSGNPLGKNPSDVWEIVGDDWEKEVWNIPNVKSNHPEKTIHPCQFPVELVERCVLALTNEGDHVFDPYCGVGSAIIAAIKRGRKAIGCDKEKRYIDKAVERTEQYYSGSLKTRPISKPVYEPPDSSKISQKSDAFVRLEMNL